MNAHIRRLATGLLAELVATSLTAFIRAGLRRRLLLGNGACHA